jgi:hypothetical protein
VQSFTLEMADVKKARTARRKTKRVETATRHAPSRVSAKRLLPRIEALERDVDPLNWRIASPAQGCIAGNAARRRARDSHREPGCCWPGRARSARGGKLMGYLLKGVHAIVDGQLNANLEAAQVRKRRRLGRVPASMRLDRRLAICA